MTLGIKVVYDLNLPMFERVVSVEVRRADCAEEVYEPLNLNRMYRLVLPSFLAVGVDRYEATRQHLQNRKIGGVDIDYMEAYLQANSPVTPEVEGRIVFINEVKKHGMEMRYKKYI